mmetsp:Transcript_21912/g.56091  ORF Transcript_21912/g.56091 Transcript_21912/m.56091 type:complete len:286 (+) Transcript_21912:100-957(+)
MRRQEQEEEQDQPLLELAQNRFPAALWSRLGRRSWRRWRGVQRKGTRSARSGWRGSGSVRSSAVQRSSGSKRRSARRRSVSSSGSLPNGRTACATRSASVLSAWSISLSSGRRAGWHGSSGNSTGLHRCGASCSRSRCMHRRWGSWHGIGTAALCCELGFHLGAPTSLGAPPPLLRLGAGAPGSQIGGCAGTSSGCCCGHFGFWRPSGGNMLRSCVKSWGRAFFAAVCTVGAQLRRRWRSRKVARPRTSTRGGCLGTPSATGSRALNRWRSNSRCTLTRSCCKTR